MTGKLESDNGIVGVCNWTINNKSNSFYFYNAFQVYIKANWIHTTL